MQMNTLAFPTFDVGSIVRGARELIPAVQDEKTYGAQQDQAVQQQADIYGRLAGMPALSEPSVFGNKKKDLTALAAGIVASLFDNSGQATKAILDGYTQGRLLDVDRQTKNDRAKRQQEIGALEAEGRSAQLKGAYAGQRREEARNERIRIETRNDRKIAQQETDRLRAENQAEVNLDRAQGRYNSASTFDEKIQAGRNLQRLQRDRGVEPITDEEIAAAAAAIKSGRLEKAQKAARSVYESDVKAYGFIPEDKQSDYEEQIQGIADDYGIDRKQLPQVPTLETLAKQKFDFWKKDVDRRFKHLQETDRQRLAQGLSRINIARDALKQAADRLAVSRDMVTIAAYRAATDRYNAEVRAAKGEINQFESGDLGKLNHQIAMLQADLESAATNEDDEKEVELRGRLGVLESERDAMQEKLFSNLGIEIIRPDPLGGVGAVPSGNGPAPKPSIPAGPNVGGTDLLKQAKDAIAKGADPAKVKARYEKLTGSKWPG